MAVIASGKAGMPEIVDAKSAEYLAFREAVTNVAILLAQAIVRDGEGATKFITVKVEAGRNVEECRKVAFAIAHSTLKLGPQSGDGLQSDGSFHQHGPQLYLLQAM